MTEIEISGVNYRVGKLNAFQQFHVSRKIAPLIPPLIPIFMKIARQGGFMDSLKNGDAEGLDTLLQPFAQGLATLPDESAEYVISTCLSAVRRQTTSDHWAPIWSSSANTVMFEDINELPKIIQLVLRVIQDNLGPFITGLLTSQQAAAKAP